MRGAAESSFFFIVIAFFNATFRVSSVFSVSNIKFHHSNTRPVLPPSVRKENKSVCLPFIGPFQELNSATHLWRVSEAHTSGQGCVYFHLDEFTFPSLSFSIVAFCCSSLSNVIINWTSRHLKSSPFHTVTLHFHPTKLPRDHNL